MATIYFLRFLLRLFDMFEKSTSAATATAAMKRSVVGVGFIKKACF